MIEILCSRSNAQIKRAAETYKTSRYIVACNMGFKVAGHLKHLGATPSPPAGIVVKHPKTTWQLNGHCPSRVFFETQTQAIISVCPRDLLFNIHLYMVNNKFNYYPTYYIKSNEVFLASS